jgi:hypothetical protein
LFQACANFAREALIARSVFYDLGLRSLFGRNTGFTEIENRFFRHGCPPSLI